MKTKAIGIRVQVLKLEEINRRASRRGITFNKWVNWAIVQGLRSHKKLPTRLDDNTKGKREVNNNQREGKKGDKQSVSR